MIARAAIWMLAIAALGPTSGRADELPPSQAGDNRLETARRFVEQSDRHLHHDQLRRGMKGYGLTVLAGTEVVRFEAEIVSVVRQWGPKRDVILARLSGQNLQETGIISGMSGSPVYVTDPADGKDKLIGAVAYGWFGQKEPLCGIQPITQMLAIAGVLSDEPAKAGGGLSAAPMAGEEFLSLVLDPAKREFPAYLNRTPAVIRGLDGRLMPIKTPVMISNATEPALGLARDHLGALGMICLPAGGVSGSAKPAHVSSQNAPGLAPGDAIAVLLATGDMEFSAIGTVTDVIGDKVLAFGHAFFSEGETALPMGRAYVHTVVSGLFNSFKLAAPLEQVGMLRRDERVGISGVLGLEAPMIPVAVTVNWPDDGRSQDFHFQMASHPQLTPLITGVLVSNAAHSYRDPPQRHTVRHEVDVDFGDLGRYHAANVSSDVDVSHAVSDVIRPIFALLDNPLGKPAKLHRVQVRLDIQGGARWARIEGIRLDGSVYKPGETLTGRVAFRPFRAPRKFQEMSFKLPENLPDGDYVLSVCSAAQNTRIVQSEMPHLFDPKTPRQLLESIQRVVESQADNLYFRLPLKPGQAALGQRELAGMPGSRLHLLEEANELDTYQFVDSVVKSVVSDYVFRGSAEVRFAVRRRPEETLLRQ